MTVWTSTTDADLVPYPEDDALGVDGDVGAGIAVLRDTHDGGVALLTGIWSAQPSTLEMTFEGDEVVLVLEGSAHLTVGDVDVFLRPGTTASFQAGESATWRILEPFKQFFVLVTGAR